MGLKRNMSKKKKETIESSSSLEELEPGEEISFNVTDPVKVLQKEMDEMKLAHNSFVKAMAGQSQKQDQILQLLIRPPEIEQEIKLDEDGKPIKQEVKSDPRSQGVGEIMSKKIGEASVGELVQAGDLALRVHDRRQGLTDLEEFMVGMGKNTMMGFGQAPAHTQGTKSV